MDCIDLVMDLRQASLPNLEPASFQRLWQAVESSLMGKILQTGQLIQMKTGAGVIRLEIIRAPASPQPLQPSTPLALRSILERPTLTHFCSACPPEAKRYAPFECVTCVMEQRDAVEVCFQHATLLDGALDAFCPAHVPTCCACPARATRWCEGRCKQAICALHGTAHPNDPSRCYCLACYEALFPRCAVTPCPQLGTFTCDFVVSSTHQPCGQRVCPEHARQWKIYGPEREGLMLCPTHRNLTTLSPEALIYQLAAGTLLRNRRMPPQEPLRIPGYMGTRHVIIKQLKRTPSQAQIRALYAGLQQRLVGKSPFEALLRTRLEETLKRIDQTPVDPSELQRVRLQEQLSQALQSLGKPELAREIQATDYKPSLNLLFISLPKPMRGAVEQAKPRLEKTLGVSLRWEKDSL